MSSLEMIRQITKPALVIGMSLFAMLQVNAYATPVAIKTEQYAVQIVTVAKGLEVPWGLAFLPDGQMLVTERGGRLRVIRAGTLLPKPVDGVPKVAVRGQGGLMDVIIHPEFAKNRWVYLSYSAGERDIGVEVARGAFNCDGDACRLTDVKLVFTQRPKTNTGFHFGSRLVWDKQGHLFVTLGDRGDKDEAQQRQHHIGKVVRITADGGVPADNPFVGKSGYAPEVFSLGNRNVQGAALHPQTGELWANEHGPQGGDEVNIIRAGKNYGWPVVTEGVNYGIGTKIAKEKSRPDMEEPLKLWVPTSIAPSGMAFYTGDAFPQWKGNAFIGGLRDQSLVRLTVAGNRVTGEERIKGTGRTRDVRMGPDGFLYVLSETEGAVLRLEPAKN
jgi:aldose sugar dehydrogenase